MDKHEEIRGMKVKKISWLGENKRLILQVWKLKRKELGQWETDLAGDENHFKKEKL